MRRIRVSRLVALIGLVVGCGDEDIDDGTNAEDSSSGTAVDSTSGTPSDGSSGASTDASSGGVADPTTTGGNGICAEPNEQCLGFDEATCTCNGCFDSCVTDRGPSSDCVCNACDDDRFCMNPKNCVDGNGCDPFIEGCQCADCAEHPLCT